MQQILEKYCWHVSKAIICMLSSSFNLTTEAATIVKQIFKTFLHYDSIMEQDLFVISMCISIQQMGKEHYLFSIIVSIAIFIYDNDVIDRWPTAHASTQINLSSSFLLDKTWRGTILGGTIIIFTWTVVNVNSFYTTSPCSSFLFCDFDNLL